MRNLRFSSAFIAQIILTSTADADTDADSRLWFAIDVVTYINDVAALWDGKLRGWCITAWYMVITVSMCMRPTTVLMVWGSPKPRHGSSAEAIAE